MFKNISPHDTALIKRLLKDSFKNHKILYGKAIFSMIIVALTTAMSAWMMRSFINILFKQTSFYDVLAISAAIIAIFLIKGLATYGQIYYLSKAGNRAIAYHQNKIFDKLINQGASFFQQHLSSDIVMRITTSATQAKNIIDILISNYIRDLISVIALLFVMCYSNIYLALSGLILGPAFYYLVIKKMKKIRALAQDEMGYMGQIVQIIQDTTRGIKVIKAFALENVMKERMQDALQNLENRSNQISRLRATASPIMETIIGASIGVICAISGYITINNAGTPGDLMAFITALLMSFEPARRLANSSMNIQANMVGVRMMFALLDSPLTMQEDDSPQQIDWSQDRDVAIEFKDVYFRYENQDGENSQVSQDKWILDGINLKIAKRDFVALVGKSGAGKSTIINMLLRLYDPDQGEVFINGVDIKHASFASLRHSISYVSQDTFLFNGTIGYNIALGRHDASEQEIIDAAKIANADQFITSLPQGYATLIGEGGVELSGGQKQRIALARALVRKSEIIILDEATSALDSVSENLFRKALENIAYNHTIVTIAHRFSTITGADNIIVMDNGKIVQQGNYKDLVNKAGHFKDLNDHQLLYNE